MPNMTDTDLEDLAINAAQTASRPVQNAVRLVLAAVLTAASGGGVWLYTTDEKITAAAVHEAKQDDRIAANTRATERNGLTIRRIGVLLVQQGRHVEDMVTKVARGEEVPDRPRALDDIEAKILAEPID